MRKIRWKKKKKNKNCVVILSCWPLPLHSANWAYCRMKQLSMEWMDLWQKSISRWCDVMWYHCFVCFNAPNVVLSCNSVHKSQIIIKKGDRPVNFEIKINWKSAEQKNKGKKTAYKVFFSLFVFCYWNVFAGRWFASYSISFRLDEQVWGQQSEMANKRNEIHRKSIFSSRWVFFFFTSDRWGQSKMCILCIMRYDKSFARYFFQYIRCLPVLFGSFDLLLSS